MKAKSFILAAALFSLTAACDEAITDPERLVAVLAFGH